MSIYFNSKLEKKIDIKASNINGDIDEIILNILKEKVGNKCIKEGFIKKHSIKILNRSVGLIQSSHFNGNIRYNITYSADICNPSNGSIIECRVKNKNKMGILAESIEFPSPLTILIATQHHIDNELYSSIEIGSIIFVEVIGKKYELYDKKISIISRFTDIKHQTVKNNLTQESITRDKII